MPLKPEIKEKWCQALESGKYQQTRQALCDSNGYCCLGVLAEILGKLSDNHDRFGRRWFMDSEGRFWYGQFPGAYLEELGLSSEEETQLINMNDRKSFKEIAAYIRENL